jgi:hypothetical protein
MDTRPTDYIRHRLARFSDAIEETRNNFCEISAFGKYPASAPYYEKSGILVQLNALSGDPAVRDELMRDFHRIGERLEILEQERGEAYRQKLLDELHACVDVYAAAVCHANTGRLSFDADHELFRRDRITVLVHELERDHDLTGIHDLVRQLDANLFPPSGYPAEGVCATPGQLSGTEYFPESRDRIES